MSVLKNVIAAFLGFELNDPVLWIVAGSIIIAVVAIIVIIALTVKMNRSKRAGIKAPKIKVKDGVRYSADDTIQVGKSLNVSHNQGDFALAKGKTVTARKGGELLPGQYTVLTTARGEDKFNIRLGGYLREYSHGDSIVIPEGESITCTSHSILLR